MLYKIAHLLRDNLSFIWEILESVNSFFFICRYHLKLKLLEEPLKNNSTSQFAIRLAEPKDVMALVAFFAAQPESDFEFFRPHGFDENSLKPLLERTSFLMFMVEEDQQMVGYFFLRSFCHGESYLGKMVDHSHQGKGIGKLMCKAAMDVALTLGIRMFESINKENVASMKSSSVLKQVVVKELKDGDLLIEDFPLDV